MYEVNQLEATIGPDGSLTIPVSLLRTLLWRPGQQVLLEQTDDGLLLSETGMPEYAAYC